MIVRGGLPRTIERGATPTLILDVYADDNTQQTADSGTVTLYHGSRAIVDGRALASSGPPAAVALLAGDTSSEALTDRGLELWALVIDGTPYTFRRPFMLVRHAFYPTIVDSDLTDRHSELADASILPPDLTSYQKYRVAAAERIERLLLRKGRRPHLVFDAWALTDAHIALTLHMIFLNFFNRLNSETYKTLADHYAEQFEREFAAIDFRYDETETGTIDSDATVAAVGSLTLTAGPPARGWW